MEGTTILGLGSSVFTLLLLCGIFGATFVAYGMLALVGKRPRSAEQAARGDTVFLPLFLREYWDWVTRPAVNFLVRIGATPDSITWASLFISMGAAAAFAFGRFGLAGWLYIFAGTGDMLDGKVARATGGGTKAGAFVDSTLDRYTEIFVLAGLAWYFRETAVLWAALFAMAGSLMVSYTRARGEGLGYSCREGGMQRAERIVYVGLAAVFGSTIDAFRMSQGTSQTFVAAALTLMAISANITAMQRFWAITRHLKQEEAEERRSRQIPPDGARSKVGP